MRFIEGGLYPLSNLKEQYDQKRIFIRGRALLLLLLALISSCTPTYLTPPTLSITSPAPNSPVSRMVAVLVNAVDNMGVSSVDLYVRGKGSSGRGIFVNFD